ncbi:MAG: helix-turn-helix domain-containing protein [Fusicatenibacter sp.]|nr:AraC family transcriptional regulator [Fusicatenibacter sp.]
MDQKDRYSSKQTRKETITLPRNQKIRLIVSDDHGSFSPSHYHEAIEVICVLEGSSVVTLPDRTVTLESGQFLVINSGLVHTARCPSSGNRTILIQIPDEFLSAYLPDPSQLWFSIDYNSSSEAVQKKIQRLRELLLDMGKMKEEEQPGYMLGVMKLLFEFMEVLYQNFLHETPGDYHPKSARVLSRLDAVLNFTQENYARAIPLREVSSVAALQPEYFCRFFRQNMGMTYNAYLNDYRLSRVYRDLIATDMGVGELAEKHGLTNEKLFHRLFRERFHMTPLQVRKMARLAENGK